MIGFANDFGKNEKAKIDLSTLLTIGETLPLSTVETLRDKYVAQIAEAIGKTTNEIEVALSLNYKIEDENEIKSSINQILLNDSIAVNLFDNFNVSQLKEVRSLLLQIGDNKGNVYEYAQRLLEWQNNSKLQEGLTDQKKALDEGKISYAEHNEAIQKFGNDLGLSGEQLKVFVQLFGKRLPELDTTVSESVKNLSSLVDKINTLKTAYDTLSNGETLSFDNILKLIEQFPDLADYMEVDVDGIVSINKDAIKSVIDAEVDTFKNGIEDRKAIIELSIDELEQQLSETSDAFARQNIQDQIDQYNEQLSSLGKVENIDVANQTINNLKLIANAINKYKNATRLCSH